MTQSTQCRLLGCKLYVFVLVFQTLSAHLVNANEWTGPNTQNSARLYLSGGGQTNTETIWSSISRSIWDQKNASISPCDDFYSHTCSEFLVDEVHSKKFEKERNLKTYLRLKSGIDQAFQYEKSNWFQKVAIIVDKCSSLSSLAVHHGSCNFSGCAYETQRHWNFTWEPPSTTKECLEDLLLWDMDIAAARLIIDDYLKPSTQLDLITLTSFVKRAFTDYINEFPALDASSKRFLLNKLNAMKPNLGWPKWIMNDDALDNWYEKLIFSRDDTLCEIKHALCLFKHQSEKIRNKSSFMNELLFVSRLNWRNAHYVPPKNSFYVYRGFLRIPWIFPHMPAVLNFATVGHTIAHEIMHGFDAGLRKYDYSGDVRRQCQPETRSLSAGAIQRRERCQRQSFGKMLSKRVAVHFSAMDSCLSSYYNKTQFCLLPNLCVDGPLTVSENQADIVGLKMALAAYHLWANENGLRLDKFHPSSALASDDAVFFYAYARNWCNKKTIDYMREILAYDPHAPPPTRVNVPLQFMQEFRNSFQCPEYSFMAPPMNQSCSVWY